MLRNKLFMTANRIATFFESQPRDDAAERVAAHLSDFWNPGMRAEFVELVEAGATDRHPLAAEAAAQLKAHAARVDVPRARPTLPGEKPPGPGGCGAATRWPAIRTDMEREPAQRDAEPLRR